MKTRFYNIIVPKFLRNFDDYLLRNYPVVWRTKAICVLFYGLVGAVLLFAAGFFYPVDAQHLTVNPYQAIRIIYEKSYLWSAFFVIICIFYWAYCQFQLGFPFTTTKDTLLTLLLYTGCFWLLFGITMPAYRMGTIIRTAYFWIDNKDLQALENDGIYPYGFVLLKSDTIIYKTTPADTFFQSREAIFKSIYKVEDTLFQSLYTTDTTFWIGWFNEHQLYSDLESYLWYLSDRLYQSYLSDESYLSIRSNLSDLSYRSYSLDKSDLSYRLYRSDRSDLSYWSYQSDRSDRLYLSYLSAYNQYKFKTIREFVNRFNQFKFKNTQDTIWIKDYDEIDNITIYRPSLPYSVEKTVHSVKNARLYLQEYVYFKHWQLLLSYILLLSLMLYFISFLLLRHLLVLIALCAINTAIVTFLNEKNIITRIINDAYLIIPTLSCLWILFLAFKRQKLIGFMLSIQGLFISLVVVLISALLTIYEVNFMSSYTFAFYGVQVLGVLGAVLTTYVRTLPKQ